MVPLRIFHKCKKCNYMKIEDNRLKGDYWFVCSDIDAKCTHPDRPYKVSVSMFTTTDRCIIDGSQLSLDNEQTVVLRR